MRHGSGRWLTDIRPKKKILEPDTLGSAAVPCRFEWWVQSTKAPEDLRLLMNLADDLLSTAARQEREQLDEKLFFEVFNPDPKPAAKRILP